MYGDILPVEFGFFAGYRGWVAGQLVYVLEDDSWMLGRISQERFFKFSAEELWEKSMSELGGRYKIWANFPEDPIMN